MTGKAGEKEKEKPREDQYEVLIDVFFTASERALDSRRRERVYETRERNASDDERYW